MINSKSALFLGLIVGTSLWTGCDEDDTQPSIDEPSTYVFTRDGESTVSFSGQTTRIAMAEEIIAALKNTDFDATSISSMFGHEEGASDFSDSDLNSSDKSVKSKTAASTDFYASNTTESNEVKADFETWIESQATTVFDNWDEDAAEGVAGGIQEAGGGSTRYVNANGLEYDQAFTKSLIGGLMTDQALNNYLSTAVLDAGTNIEDNDNGITVEDKSYTNMEHKWDEAYGYIYGAAPDAANPNATIGSDDNFLNKYIGRVEGDEDFAGIANDIYNAFKTGRAAIVAGEYTTRDEQAEVIRLKISEIIAIRAVYYLQQAKVGMQAGTPDMASILHDLSEGFGFIYSLQFTRQSDAISPYFTRSEVEGFIDTVYPTDSGANGFWDVSEEDLDSVSETIAAKFDFTVEQAGS